MIDIQQILQELSEHDTWIKEVKREAQLDRKNLCLDWVKKQLNVVEGSVIEVKQRINSKRCKITNIKVVDYIMNSENHIDVQVSGWLIRNSDNKAYKYVDYHLYSSFSKHQSWCVEYNTKDVNQQSEIPQELINELFNTTH